MLKFFAVSALFITNLVCAGTFSSLNVARLVDPRGRAEFDISRYNPRTLNFKFEVQKIAKGHASCGEADIRASHSDVLSALNRFYDETTLASALARLIKQKRIVLSLGASDGSEGESEYCSTTTMKFYSVDGEILTLYFDYNT